MTIWGIYGSVLERSWKPVLGIALVASLAAYGIAVRLGPTYEAHYSYLVSLEVRDHASDFRYDGFYALQASDLFSSTLAKMATTPETIKAALDGAGIHQSRISARELAGIVQAEKTAPQLVQVTVKNKDSNQVQAITKSLQEVVLKQLGSYQDNAIPDVAFKVVPTAVWVGVSQIKASFVGLVVFVAIFLIGINLVLLREAIKQA